MYFVQCISKGFTMTQAAPDKNSCRVKIMLDEVWRQVFVFWSQMINLVSSSFQRPAYSSLSRIRVSCVVTGANAPSGGVLRNHFKSKKKIVIIILWKINALVEQSYGRLKKKKKKTYHIFTTGFITYNWLYSPFCLFLNISSIIVI